MNSGMGHPESGANELQGLLLISPFPDTYPAADAELSVHGDLV